MKQVYYKHEKELYLPKAEPTLVTVPAQKFFAVKGEGDPNSEEFAEKTALLYALSYTLKMLPKKGIIPEGYFDYTVYPLEGLWTITDEAVERGSFGKEDYLYTLMIRQPDFLTGELAQLVFEVSAKKVSKELLDQAFFAEIEDGLSLQMLHIGNYATESQSFDRMKAFMKEQNLEVRTWEHREIYLSDPRKVAPEALKTVLRYRLKRSH